MDGGFQKGDKRAGVTRSVNPVTERVQIDTGADGSGFWLRGPGNHFHGNFAYDAARPGDDSAISIPVVSSFIGIAYPKKPTQSRPDIGADPKPNTQY